MVLLIVLLEYSRRRVFLPSGEEIWLTSLDISQLLLSISQSRISSKDNSLKELTQLPKRENSSLEIFCPEDSLVLLDYLLSILQISLELDQLLILEKLKEENITDQLIVFKRLLNLMESRDYIMDSVFPLLESLFIELSTLEDMILERDGFSVMMLDKRKPVSLLNSSSPNSSSLLLKPFHSPQILSEED